MSKAYCISYDLKNSGGDYSGLFKVLKASKHWWHYLESTWLVVVDEPYDKLWRRLEPHVEANDRLLVIGITAESTGWLPTKAWEWIRRNVDSLTESA